MSKSYNNYKHHLGRVKRIWYLSPIRAAKVQASLRIRAVSPEPSLLAHTSSESRGTFRQKARSLAPLNGWSCAVKFCHDGMLEDTNSLDGAHLINNWFFFFNFNGCTWHWIGSNGKSLLWFYFPALSGDIPDHLASEALTFWVFVVSDVSSCRSETPKSCKLRVSVVPWIVVVIHGCISLSVSSSLVVTLVSWLSFSWDKYKSLEINDDTNRFVYGIEQSSESWNRQMYPISAEIAR